VYVWVGESVKVFKKVPSPKFQKTLVTPGLELGPVKVTGWPTQAEPGAVKEATTPLPCTVTV